MQLIPALAVLVVLLTPAAAKKAVDEGQKAQKAGKFEDARAAFERAVKEGSGVEAKLGLARAESSLGHTLVARDLYAGVLSDKSLSKAQVKPIEAEKKANDDRIATLHVKTESDAEVTVDGRPAKGKTELDPGSHVVVVTAAGKNPFRETISLGDGAKRELRPELSSPEPRTADKAPPSSNKRSLGVAAVVLGGVALTAGAYFAWTAKRTRGVIRDNCNGNVCPPSARGEVDRGKRQANLATLGLGVGVVAIATGVTILLVQTEPEKGEARLVVSPSAVQLVGTF